MPKDNENMQLPDEGSLLPADSQRFAPAEMVRCEKCLRANPPNRAACLYCAAPLDTNETIADLRIPPKPVDDSTLGFNVVVHGSESGGVVSDLEALSRLLALTDAELERIIAAKVPLPLARTGKHEEAEAIGRKLAGLGVTATIVSDVELGLKESPIQVRAAEVSEMGLKLKQAGARDGFELSWSDIALVVSGRLITKRVESAEQKGRRGEREVVEATEFFADELVMDIYSKKGEGFRVSANSFDFSLLHKKSLVAAENFSLLLELLRQHATAAQFDDSYAKLRTTLNSVWPTGQHTEAGGLRRERPGKFKIGSVTASSNAAQFTRYSRLRQFLVYSKSLE